MDNIYNVLSNYLKRSNKNNTNEVICRFMLNHLLEIPEMSVSQIADACYTSHPSVIRFTREIGFEGMADFKYSVQNYIDEIKNHELRVHFSLDISSDERYVSSLKEWLASQNDYCLHHLSLIDRSKMVELCRQIHGHENVCLCGAGLSNVIGEIFRIELARCGKIISNISPDLDSIDALSADNTLLIIISMYGYFISNVDRERTKGNLKQYLKKHADRSYLITLNGKGMFDVTDETIGIGDRNSSFDVTLNLMILFMEILAECYQQMYPE